MLSLFGYKFKTIQTGKIPNQSIFYPKFRIKDNLNIYVHFCADPLGPAITPNKHTTGRHEHMHKIKSELPQIVHKINISNRMS